MGRSGRPDIATLGGFLLAAGGVVGGLILEGGRIADIAQQTAAMIVLGGTLGAVLVSSPLATIRGACRRFGSVLFEKRSSAAEMIEEIIGYAVKARKSGLVSLEEEAERASHPSLRKALQLAVDGTDMQEIRTVMELDIAMEEACAESEAKVFEAAGGYAPTIGILGAVMGLIQVMKDLSDIEKVGHGIAVAFVATIYGVGIANLFFLPAASKIRARAAEESQLRELALEGVLSLVEGLNPKLIRSKLEAYSSGAARQESSTRVSRQAVYEG
ncbi:MAG: flagellar motor protein [Bryobacteraceae bacterium]